LAASIAIEAGSPMMDALAGRAPYRTRQEFLAAASAEMDLQDARDAAAEKAAFRRWQARWHDDHQGDTSAPTEAEIEAEQAMAARAAEYRRKRREASKVITAARRFAQWDRGES
jgi:hypothetical protein